MELLSLAGAGDGTGGWCPKPGSGAVCGPVPMSRPGPFPWQGSCKCGRSAPCPATLQAAALQDSPFIHCRRAALVLGAIRSLGRGVEATPSRD